MWQKFLCRDLVSGLVAEFRVSVPREQEVWRQRAAAPGAGPFSWLLPSARADDVSAFLETPLFRSAVRDRLFLRKPKSIEEDTEEGEEEKEDTDEGEEKEDDTEKGD